MLVEVILYHHERNAFELRRHVLRDVVDATIVVEGTRTFQGEPCDPTFPEEWLSEVDIFHRHLQIPESARTPFEREAALRRLAAVSAGELFPEAYVLVSDADEIPNPRDLLSVPTRPVRLWTERHFYWTLDWEFFQPGGYECAPFVVHASKLGDAEKLRRGRGGVYHNFWSGWEFSFLGSVEFAQEKIQSFSHAELNRADVLEAQRLEDCIKYGRDPNPDRNIDCIPCTIDDSYPVWVRQHPEWVHARRLSRHDWK